MVVKCEATLAAVFRRMRAELIDLAHLKVAIDDPMFQRLLPGIENYARLGRLKRVRRLGSSKTGHLRECRLCTF